MKLVSSTLRRLNLCRERFQSCCVIKVSVHEFGVPSFLLGYRNDVFVVVLSGEGLLGFTIKCSRKETSDTFSGPLRVL